jgi:uncharacterized lipoprotein
MPKRVAVPTLIAMLVLAGSVVAPAMAAGPVTHSYAAPVDRVWSTTLAVLKQLGWDVDKVDRSIGWITTESRRVEGEDYGVYAKGTRQRLTLHVKAAGDNRTTISVERAVFKRERILWMDKDEPITVSDQEVENALLVAIEKSL